MRSFALFAELSNSELESLSHLMEDLELDHGVSLLKQNEFADAVYFLKKGAVKILVNGEMVAQIDRVQCFGEMSCLAPDTRASASVITAERSQLMRIEKQDFLRSVNQMSKLWRILFLQTSERVRSLNGRLSEILNHLPQGLVKVSPQGVVSNDYSVQCSKYFQRENLAGLSFPTLIFPGSGPEPEPEPEPEVEEKRKSWLENLSLLFSESNMSFESCAALLTSEFTLKTNGETRYFAMSYAPCLSLTGKIIAVDIGIEDLTIQKELEIKHRESKLREDRLAKITQSPDSFINFLALAEETYLDTADFLAQLKQGGADSVRPRIEQMMRRLHSLKGISGVFSLQNLKAVVHESETIVSKLKTPGGDLAQIVASLEERVRAFLVEKDLAQGVFDQIPADLRRRLVGVVFSPEEFQKMKSLIEAGNAEATQKVLASVEKVDSKKLVAQWPHEAQKIAEAIGKSVQFNVAGEGGRISKDIFTQLDQVLIHLLRNGMDHGLETPDERVQAGKPPQGKITAMIDVTETELVMVVEDDGRGINGEALAKRARQNPNLDQALIESYVAKSEHWKILLMPGFSTAKEITDLSGRGVGLDAVASTIVNMGGSLSIESTFGEGACIFITVPV